MLLWVTLILCLCSATNALFEDQIGAFDCWASQPESIEIKKIDAPAPAPARDSFVLIGETKTGLHNLVSIVNGHMPRPGTIDVELQSGGTYPTLELFEHSLNKCLIINADGKPHVVCVSSNPTGDTQVYNIPILATDHNTTQRPEWTGSIPLSHVTSELKSIGGDLFLLSSPTGSASVYQLQSTGSIVLKYTLKNVMLSCLARLDGRIYLFTAHHETDQLFNNFAVSVYLAESGVPVDAFPTRQWTIALHHGAVQSIHSVMFTDASGSPNFRLLIRTEDHAVQMIRQNGRQQWLRDEALAEIMAVEMVDLPVSESQARMEDEFGHTHNNILEMFVKRIRTQAAQLLAFIRYGFNTLPRTLHAYLTATSNLPVNPSGSVVSGDSEPVYAVPPRLAQIQPEINQSTVGRPDGERDITIDQQDPALTRDNFNVNKMIVVATAVGKLFGLESEKGRVVWAHLVRSGSAAGESRLALFQQRNTAHFPLPPMSTLLIRSKITGNPLLFSFNPITGVPFHKSPTAVVPGPPGDVLQAILLPGAVREENDFLRPILMLTPDMQIHVYPPESASEVEHSITTQPLYLYTVEHASAQLTGYLVARQNPSAAASADGQKVEESKLKFKAVRAWQMRLQTVSAMESSREDSAHPHQISLASARPGGEHIYSVGRVLGDRSVLYKYLNPNLIAVLTVGGDAAAQTNAVTLYLIDVVAGRVVYSATHRRCTAPLTLIHSENYVLYSYYNQKSLRHEVTVVELYEPMTETTKGPQLCSPQSVPTPAQLFLSNILPTSWFASLWYPTTETESTTTKESSAQDPHRLMPSSGSRAIFSSLQRSSDVDGRCSSTGGSPSVVPIVVQQSYILTTPPNHGVSATSITERGITSKSIIFGLQKGAIIELPKAFFDPRRTLDMTPELMEEGVHPYTPVIPLSDLAVISYNHSVMRTRAIRTAVTGLESTSLVFAYGLDLFFTRIAPSLTFDLLKEDFDYTAIAIATLGMIVASVVTQRLAARRAVFHAWA